MIIEALYGDLISKIVRDLLFDTQIKIKKNSGIFLQEKFSFILKQNRKLLLKETSLSQISKLLTTREKQWLNDEIERFFKD